jgi:outer membrane protein OmpA-like peptidoglycan-associated protein
MNAIIQAGIPAERLGATGFGQERPVADNRSEEGRARNRRVELVKAS